MDLKIDILPIIPENDNYAYVITTQNGVTAVVDPGDADPIIAFLDEHDLSVDYIINTHFHWDHVNGNPKIKKKYNCKVIAPAKEAGRIKGGVDMAVGEGDEFNIGDHVVRVIDTPGHTAGGVCYYIEESGVLFTGDTLFSLGCGRVFDGTVAQLYHSFQKLKALPDETLIYCGHEYTRGNAGFCLSVDRNNKDLLARVEDVKAYRDEGKPTIPVTLGLEKKTNVFMKAKSAEEFAALRLKKDNF